MTAEPPQGSRFWRIIKAIVRPKFSLRTLLGLMFLFAVTFGWYAHRVREQEEACAILTKYRISWSHDSNPWWYDKLPEWARKDNAGHWIQSIDDVEHDGASTGKSDEDEEPAHGAAFKAIARIPRLKKLTIDYTRQTVEEYQADMAALRSSRAIESIEFDSGCNGVAAFRALPPMPGVRNMELSDYPLTREDMKSFERFPNLRSLHLAVYDADTLPELRRLRHLEELTVRSSSVDDAGFEEICRHRGLKRLSVNSCLITDAALVHLRNLPRMEDLSIYHNSITSASVPHILACRNLKALDVDSSDLTDADIERLVRGLPLLERLDIQKTFATKTAFRAIVEHPKWQRVTIPSGNYSFNEIRRMDPKAEIDGSSTVRRSRGDFGHFDKRYEKPSDGDLELDQISGLSGNLEVLRNNTTIDDLDLFATDVNDDDLAVVATIAKLEELKLMDTKVSDAGIAHFANHATLRRLDIDGTKVGDAGLATLATVTTLEHLDISATLTTPRGFAPLADVKALTSIRLGAFDYAAYPAEDWRKMANIDNLTLFNLQGPCVKPFPFHAFPNITRLTISNSSPLPATFFEELKGLKRLTDIDVDEVTDADTFVGYIAGAKNLVELEFDSEAGLSHEGFAALRTIPGLERLILQLRCATTHQLSGLAGHRTLERLQIGWAEFDESVLSVLATFPALDSCTVNVLGNGDDIGLDSSDLRFLRGENLGGTTRHVWPIRSWRLPPNRQRLANLLQSTELTDLFLQDETLDDEFMAGLVELPKLDDLSFENCKLPDSAGKHLAKLPKLTVLRLKNTPVPEATAAEIGKARLLATLLVEGTPVPAAWTTEIAQLTKLNHVRLEGTRVEPELIAAILKLPELEDLDLRKTNVNDVMLAGIAAAPNLTKLDVSETETTDHLLELLKGHPKLIRLATNTLDLQYDKCNVFLRGQNLFRSSEFHLNRGILKHWPDARLDLQSQRTALTLDDTGQPAELLRQARTHCPFVNNVTFLKETITREVMETLPPRLRTLRFYDCKFEPGVLAHGDLSHLTDLNLDGKTPADLDLGPLSRCRWLKSVDAEDTVLTPEQVLQFVACRGLRTLDLERTRVEESIAEQLLTLESLRILSVADGSLSAETIQRLTKDRPWLDLRD